MIALVFKYNVEHGLDFDRFVPRLRLSMLRSMRSFGRRTETNVRRIMRSAKWEKNSPPWAAVKGSSRSLYHTGHMSTTLKSRVTPGVGDVFVEVEVGWIDRAQHPRAGGAGRSIQEIIGIITTEHKWTPDEMSKAAFWAKVPKEWKKNNPPINKPQWEIPARDFMTEAANDPRIAGLFASYVAQASEQVMRARR